MNLAVTGGAGFLGYHICKRLSDKFSKIVIIDIAEINKEEYPGNCTFFKVDVRDRQKLKSVLKEVDFVIHSAAALPLWKKKDIFDTNIEGTKNVLTAAEDNGIKRVIFVSSTAVYGVPEKHPIYEDDPLIGVGPYGESKIIAEKICEEFRQKEMCVPIVRPKTFIGTGRLGVFQILYDWVKSGAKIPIIGSGENHYQLLEVTDLVDAIYLTIILDENKVNDTFNIGAKEFGTVNEDVGALCEFSGSGSRLLHIPSSIAKPVLTVLWTLRMSPLYKWVYGTADTDSFVSIEKAEKVLNWYPKSSNKDALIRSYKWYLENYVGVNEVGITHRVAWKQGILSIIKKLLK